MAGKKPSLRTRIEDVSSASASDADSESQVLNGKSVFRSKPRLLYEGHLRLECHNVQSICLHQGIFYSTDGQDRLQQWSAQKTISHLES